MPTFQALLSAVETVPSIVLKISIFYTRTSTRASSSAHIGRNNSNKTKASNSDEYGYGVGAGNTYAKRGPELSSEIGFKAMPGSSNQNAEISVLPVDPTGTCTDPIITTDDRISIQPGRPFLSTKLKTAAHFAAQLTSPSPSSSGRRHGHSSGTATMTATATARGVVVGVCGPGSLVSDVAAAARKVPADIRKACGGVEVHEE